MNKNKKRQYTKDQFSDKEAYNQIKDEIKQIRDRGLKQVEEDTIINKLYEDRKKQLKMTKLQQNTKENKGRAQKENFNLGDEDEEQGEIKRVQQPEPVDTFVQGAPSINDLGEHIRPITIPRNKLSQLYKSRKFEQTIKGCFVRYKSENSNSYLLALVLGVMQGEKQYIFNNIKVKTLLKLQQSSSQVIKLSMDHISNQHPPGNLEISKWLQANRSKIPKQRELKEKLQHLNSLIHGKISSDDIDRNLLQQAERAAKEKSEGTQNINELIFFMKNHIHDLTVTIQQMDEKKQKQKKDDKNSEKRHCEQILHRLIQKQSQLRQQKISLSKLQKKEKKNNYLGLINNDRKEDKIRDSYHKRIQNLCSYEGSMRIKDELKKAHQQFDIEIDI